MKIVKQEDRRGFFRITDAIGVTSEVIKESEGDEAVDTDAGEKIDARQLLQLHNDAINQSLAELLETNPEAAKAIEVLNKKVDTLIHIFELDNLSIHQNLQRVEDASISASGIAFAVDENFDSGTVLKLTLYLKSSQEKVHVIGQVVECQSIEGDQYNLRIEFTELNDGDREKLIQYIVQRQSVLLKNLREKMDEA